MSFLDRDPSIIKLTGAKMPGMVQSIKGANRKYTWDKQKGTASSGATNVFKGAEIADSIKVTVFAPTLEMQKACAAWRKYIAPVKIGGKPPTFSVENVIFEFNEISRVAIASIEAPDVSKDKNVIFVFEFTEVNPPTPAKTGPAAAAGKGSGAAGATKGGDTDIVDLQAQAAAAKVEMQKAMAKS